MRKFILVLSAAVLLSGCQASVQAAQRYVYEPLPNSTFKPLVLEADQYDSNPSTALQSSTSAPPQIRLVPKPVHVVKSVKRTVYHAPTVSAAMRYALARVGAAQYNCLYKMWSRESGWRWNAGNPYGAYGIPQALPGSKMALFGSDWRVNPITQVKWGLFYISRRYGSACSAWAFWQSHYWY